MRVQAMGYLAISCANRQNSRVLPAGHSTMRLMPGSLAASGLLLVLAFSPALADSLSHDRPSPQFRLGLGASDSPIGEAAPILLLQWDAQPWRDYYREYTVGVIGKHGESEDPARRTVGFAGMSLGKRYNRWGFSMGAVVVSRQTQALSSVGQFLTQVSYRMDTIELRFGHLSNARMNSPNRGESFLVFSRSF